MFFPDPITKKRNNQEKEADERKQVRNMAELFWWVAKEGQRNDGYASVSNDTV
jgi:hypothetical protein